MRLKPKKFMKIILRIKKCLILVIILLGKNIMMIQTYCVGKMEDETADVAIKEFVGLKPKMHSFLIDDSSEHKKAKDVNKNVVAAIRHIKCKDILLNKKCLRHLMKRIQSKDHRIEPFKSTKFLYHALTIKYTYRAMDMMD